MNGLSNFDTTGRKYLRATTDDLLRFWRSKVKVTAADEVANASTSTPGVEVHLLVRLVFTVDGE